LCKIQKFLGGKIMARRTLEERIAAAKDKIQKEENSLNNLLQEQKEKEKTARTHRFCKRMGLIESILPELKTLTDEQFEKFVKMTTVNDFGRDKLTAIVQEQSEQSITVPQGKQPKRNDEAAASQVEFADESGDSVSAQSAEIKTESV